MPRKKTPTNKRIREGQKLTRRRAVRQWWEVARRRAALIGAIACALFVLTAVGWFAYTGGFSRAARAVANSFYTQTAQLGFRTTYIYVEGRRTTTMQEIEEAIGVKYNAPILALSVSDIRTRLTGLPRIRSARVERVLPNQLAIHIEERLPVAIWQNHKTFKLLDAEGVVLPEAHIDAYGALPLVVGENAPAHTAQLLSFLYTEPELAKKIRASVMVGGRRWNIRFASGLELKLPEHNPDAAWQRFASLSREERLMARDIISVDMRLDDRIFVRPAVGLPDETQAAQGRDT